MTFCAQNSQDCIPERFHGGSRDLSDARFQETQDRSTQVRVQTAAHTQTHRHTDTQTHRHTDTQTHRHTQSMSWFRQMFRQRFRYAPPCRGGALARGSEVAGPVRSSEAAREAEASRRDVALAMKGEMMGDGRRVRNTEEHRRRGGEVSS